MYNMFIISPRGGLCNQIMTIVKGMLLAMKYGRNLYIDGFQIDYSKSELCKIEMILNIDKINDFLLQNNITNFKIITELNNEDFNNDFAPYKIINLDYSTISSIPYINNHIEENLDKKYLYLGNIISLDTYNSFGYIWTDLNNPYHLFSRNIIFNDVFYTLKNVIKTKLNLTNYTCVHLRIEDDCIHYCSKMYNLDTNEYNNKLLSFYDNEINSISMPIYICSGINNFDNKINFEYYQNLKNRNHLVYDKQNISIDKYYTSNRELMAIIDLLIAIDSYKFIGNNFSSFSILIHYYLLFNNKNSEMFNIYENV